MASPYRSASLHAPTSLAAAAARGVALWSIALRVIAAIIEAIALRVRSFDRPAIALVLGASAAMSVAGWRLFRALPGGPARIAAMTAAVLGATSVASWQPLVGGADQWGPWLALEPRALGEGLWLATGWLAAVALWFAARSVKVANGEALTEAIELERSLEARAAQAQWLRTLSSSVLGVVLSVVTGVVVALGFEGLGLHWHWCGLVRGAGMIAAALFAIRGFRATSRLQSWAPSVGTLSGGLTLLVCSVVAALFVMREWSKVLSVMFDRSSVPPAFPAQGMVAFIVFGALGLVFLATRSLAARAGDRRASWSSAIVVLALPTSVALMARIQQTMPDFIMTTDAHRTLVWATLAASATTIIALYRCGITAANALERPPVAGEQRAA